MSRGKLLTDDEKNQCDNLYAQNVSMREISRKLNRSLCVVQNYLHNSSTYGTKKSSGRPSSLSTRIKRQIGRIISNSHKSCASVKRDLNLNVTRQTVFNAIKQLPFIRRQKMQCAPRLKEHHKQKRLDFARNNMDTDWKKVMIFTILLFFYFYYFHFI